MIDLVYAPHFLRQLKKLERDLQDEAIEKITLFKDKKNHTQLKVHKLKGTFAGNESFSVNYSFRIVFKYVKKNSAALLAIGDHDVYK